MAVINRNGALYDTDTGAFLGMADARGGGRDPGVPGLIPFDFSDVFDAGDPFTGPQPAVPSFVNEPSMGQRFLASNPVPAQQLGNPLFGQPQDEGMALRGPAGVQPFGSVGEGGNGSNIWLWILLAAGAGAVIYFASQEGKKAKPTSTTTTTVKAPKASAGKGKATK